MPIASRFQGAQTGLRMNVSADSVRNRRARRPGIEALEGRALLATLQFVEPGSVLAAQLAIGAQTNAQTASPSPSSLLAHANVTINDASSNGVTVNGTPYTTYMDDGVASADLGDGSPNYPSSFSVSNDLNLAGGYPLTVSDQIGTSSGAEGSAPGSFVTLEIMPDPSDPVNVQYQINLDATYSSSQQAYLYYNAPDTYGDLDSHFIVAYATQDSSGTALDKTIGEADRGGPTDDAGSTGGEGSVSFTVGARQPFLIQVADLMDGTLGSEAYFTQVFLNPSVSDQLQVALTWQAVPLPQIAVTTPSWNSSDGGVDYGYTISGSELTQANTVALYWAPTTTFDSSQDTLIPVSVVNTQTAVGPYGPFHVTPALIGPPPQGAKYLLAVADPDNVLGNFDPTSNVKDLAIPDVEPISLVWHPSSAAEWTGPISGDPESGANAGGVDLGYTITGADLPQGVPIQLFWGNGDTKLPQTPIAVGNDGSTLVTQTAADVATYFIHIPASSLGTPPTDTDDLIAVINPQGVSNPQGNTILTEQNDSQATLAASPDDILQNSVFVATSGPSIVALFMPATGLASPPAITNSLASAKGSLTIDQAAAICGVSQFNWVQTVNLPPSGRPTRYLFRA